MAEWFDPLCGPATVINRSKVALKTSNFRCMPMGDLKKLGGPIPLNKTDIVKIAYIFLLGL